MKSKDKDKAKLAAGAVSAGYVLGSENLHPIGYMNKVYQKSRQPFRQVEEEDFKVVKKLREVARKQKTHVFDQKGDDFYHDSQMGQNNLDRAKKFIKEQKDRFKDLRYWKDSTGIDNLKGTGLEGERRSIKDAIKDAKSVLNSKDYIQIDSSKIDAGASMAHELGHSMHFHGRDGSKVGKLAHKLNHKLKHVTQKVAEKTNSNYNKVSKNTVLGLGVTGGLLSGIKAGRDEKKGKKESALNKIGSVAAPIAYKAPELVSEFEASRQGMKLLKKAGASKRYRRASLKNLGAAGGTYAAGLVTPVLAGYGARQVGKVIGRRTVRNNNKEDDNIKD